MAGLNPEDLSYFQRSRKRVDETLGLGLAQNTYQQQTLGGQRDRSLNDLTRQFQAMRTKLPYSFGKRGMYNSGAYQRTLTDFAQDKARTLHNATAGFKDQMQGLTLAQQQLETVAQQSHDDLAAQETARRAAIAAALTAARSGT